ncbi:NAD(P)-binding domain-containing protein [Corynebacterium tapiri]|uniref:NAD(P)/FAD-dependent oxidoreductase n=1 Tax=Corynebacterium tapiri TaxID=1448266 RepID=A0A5C4U5E6_9CORY|nr:NAD(P)-binding domain-containing protein [Corynebacterium tapiri]TNL98480.1 NAD(P)/FAD-dependent oxidoreductase [Corynebacterium tapiri]
MFDTVVVGGGQAGLATGYYLRRAGLEFVILDDQQGPGAAWRHMWPSMTLFSSASFSNLPGTPMPSYPGYPPAAHVVEYFRKYEARYELPIERPEHVDSVEFSDGIFSVRSADRTWQSRTVVAATGRMTAPFIPYYPGQFRGRQWHSGVYPGPEPFRGSRVAVVGSGNSGAQIAAELTEHAQVTWYTRGEPRWMPDDVDGSALFDLAFSRVAALRKGEPDPGDASSLGDIVVLPAVKKARDSGALVATPMFTSLDEVEADHLIWCTGFRPAIGAFRAVSECPGMHFVGYGDETGPGSATIIGVGQYAKRTVEDIRTLLD